MGTVAALILLALAVIISAQLLMMMDRRKPLAARLRNLNEGGDSSGLLFIGLLLGGALGAVIGSLFNHASTAAAAGAGVGLLSWLFGLIWAHRRPQPPARHREK
jgi:uncharacterized membrane protein YsdA (DUF1294 family)